jgi:hypothetical protein
MWGKRVGVDIGINREQKTKIEWRSKYPAITWTAQFLKIYIFWITLHFAVTKLFINLCVPTSMWGLIFSPLTAAAPHCQVLRWALYESGINVGLIGLAAISLVYKTLFAYKK